MWLMWAWPFLSMPLISPFVTLSRSSADALNSSFGWFFHPNWNSQQNRDRTPADHGGRPVFNFAYLDNLKQFPNRIRNMKSLARAVKYGTGVKTELNCRLYTTSRTSGHFAQSISVVSDFDIRVLLFRFNLLSGSKTSIVKGRDKLVKSNLSRGARNTFLPKKGATATFSMRQHIQNDQEIEFFTNKITRRQVETTFSLDRRRNWLVITFRWASSRTTFSALKRYEEIDSIFPI